MNKKVYVRPHLRRNSKSIGKHHVSGHTREIEGSSREFRTSFGQSKYDKSPDLDNLKMNDDVYKLRRRVIDILYDAKELCELPYITVRVTEPHQKILGQARIKDNTLWITENALDKSNVELRLTVYHEILHTVFGVPHIEGCPLMGEYQDVVIPKQRADELFKKYAKEYGGDCR